MQQAESLGLRSKDYQYTPQDTSAAKKAVQQFMLDLKFGNQAPYLRFQGFDFNLPRDAYRNRIQIDASAPCHQWEVDLSPEVVVDHSVVPRQMVGEVMSVVVSHIFVMPKELEGKVAEEIGRAHV